MQTINKRFAPPAPSGSPAPRIDIHFGADERRRALVADVVRGLSRAPKELPPKWFYDARGSELFERITELPEYYLTRRERAILAQHAPEIVRLSGADTLVELGSGSSQKTRLLLDAMDDAGSLRAFVPFDVSAEPLREAGAQVAREYPGIEVHAVVGDFDRHLGLLPRRGRRLVAMLGSTIGNLDVERRSVFFGEVAGLLDDGDAFLLGTDLVKDPGRLERAYDDAAGVTAAFNRNVLSVLNRELGATFDPSAFAHVARWDPEREWVEMRLCATSAQTVWIAAIERAVSFAEGEEMRTEISAKFRVERLAGELAVAGLLPVAFFADRAGDFGLSLWAKNPASGRPSGLHSD